MKNRKQSLVKKLWLTAVAVVLVTGMTACGFSVGNTGKSEDYKDIFTDRAAEFGNKYKASDLAYTFSLGDYGSMLVYVDTSEGHSFEVDSSNGGFLIKDADGNEVLHAYGMTDDQYTMATAETDDVRTVNGRDFFYRKDQAYHHLLSYMADCGLNCGMILESDKDESVFRLVAFRGDPIEGASSDLYYYKGQATDLGDGSDAGADASSDDGSTDGVSGSTGSTAGSAVNSSLSSEVEAAINSLDTDYSKVNWGARYSISEAYPGLVISLAPYRSYSNYLLIGITNMHDQDISFKAKAAALDQDGNEIGDMFIYEGAIGPGNTVFSEILCQDAMPDGRIHWEDVEISTDVYENYLPWVGDWKVSGDSDEGRLTIDYSIGGANNETIVPGTVTFLLLDASGNIMAKADDFVINEIASGEQYTGSTPVFGDEDLLSKVKDVAMFVKSTK